ncbi:endoplasmic reticulum mannosyl-oligosaccharide 1,2-alpha-mannosidase, partial [Aureobasidium melanogenum]
MYKDKPFASSSRRLPWFKKKRVLAALLVVFTTFFYWMGTFGGSAPKVLKSKKPANWEERRDQVRDAFKLSWSAYEQHGWGYDEFKPVSQTGRHMVKGGMGWIIVDALDTLMLMNLTTELSHARDWVSTALNYDIDHDVNTFETTIRMLGGLLSAHYLSTTFPDYAPLTSHSATGASISEDLYLEKAADLADRLLGAYDSNSGVPYASVNLHTAKGIPSHDDGGASSTAEATSLQLEMKYLAKLTGEVHYWEKAEKVMQVVDDNGMEDGLLPIFIYAQTGNFRGNNIRLGSRGDSYYEYLIKQYLQTSKQEPIYQEMWDQSLAGIQKHLITYSREANLTILGERPQGLDHPISPKMDHLVCFMPGTIALGATQGQTLAEARKSTTWGKKQESEIELAKQLMKTCWATYKVTATGLAPEITHFEMHDPPAMMPDGILQSPDTLSDDHEAEWKKDLIIKGADSHNLQRPETVESLFYMWRITGDDIYREWGWEMFESFVKHTAVDHNGGYTSINDVTSVPTTARDNMESFWLAETLKYFYLLFGPNDVLPLDKVVFNTEAHAFPTFELGKLFKTGWKRKPRDSNGQIVETAAPRDAITGDVKKEAPAAAAGIKTVTVEGAKTLAVEQPVKVEEA